MGEALPLASGTGWILQLERGVPILSPGCCVNCPSQERPWVRCYWGMCCAHTPSARCGGGKLLQPFNRSMHRPPTRRGQLDNTTLQPFRPTGAGFAGLRTTCFVPKSLPATRSLCPPVCLFCCLGKCGGLCLASAHGTFPSLQPIASLPLLRASLLTHCRASVCILVLGASWCLLHS